MKRITYLTFLLLSLSLVFLSGCKEDVLIDESEPTIEPTGPPPTEFFQTTFRGVVVDTNGEVIAGASVSADGENAISDEFGFFTLSGINAPNTGLHISAVKDGYFVGGTHFIPSAAIETTIDISLIEKRYTVFDSTEGLDAEIDGGAQIVIPANGFSRNGEAYNGSVSIATTWLNPSDPEVFRNMPGALLGINDDNEQQALQSFGMIAVEMTDNLGNEISIAEGSMATLTFPLDAELNASAESDIPLWHFNEANGVWIQEGIANKVGQSYVAEVSHFSWWNCDVPYNFTQLCLELENSSGEPLDNVQLCISDGSIDFCSKFNGSCNFVPIDRVLTVSLFDDCDNLVHTEDIGPFSGGIGMQNQVTITADIPSQSIITISGTVTDCDGNTVTNGIASATIAGTTTYDFDLDANGYEFNIIDCYDENEEVILNAINLDDFESGKTTLVLDESQNNYTEALSACGEQFSVILTLNTAVGQFVMEDVNAYQSVAETLIVGKSDLHSETILMGFRGFDTGDFQGNILLVNSVSTSAGMGIPDAASISIDTYGTVGETIRGEFQEGSVSGFFVATRLR